MSKKTPKVAKQHIELFKNRFGKETILVYKFLNMSREEIAAMFEVSDLKQTRFYQEAKK